ncbi:MAG: prolipoprotein diacylglyceryl transferase [Rikenellaceae bacterium]|nr:prolipoprotein diacylglyceryl transferase [Rikenellaceae bacterium]
MVWDFDPVMFTLFGREVYWYGFAWFLTMCTGTVLFYIICRREGLSVYKFFGIFLAGYISPIVGARLGHCFFYEWEYYSAHPMSILDFGEGGMASHGAAIGLLAGLLIFSVFAKMPYLWSLDRIMLPVAIGGALVRIGNLMNSEIYGTATDLPWGFIFVRAGENYPMHPTQIYEALCYAAVFCLLLWLYFKKDAARRYPGLMFGTGLTGIFSSRFLIEFLKRPQVGFEENMTLNMGQLLSVPFIAAGALFIVVPLLRRCRKQ